MNYDVGVVTQRLRISPDGSYAQSPVTVGGGAPAWYTLYDQISVCTTDSVGWEGYCLAQYIAPGAYNMGAPATGTQLRATISTASTVGVAFNTSYLGHGATSGDVVDFDGTQLQMLWSGSASGTVGAATTRTSDAVTYAFNKTKSLVLRMRFTGPSNVMSSGAPDLNTNYQRTFATDPTNIYTAQTDIVANGTVFDFPANGIFLFTKVEVFG